MCSSSYEKATFREPDLDEFAEYAYALQGTVDNSPHWAGRYDPDSAIRKYAAGVIKAVVINETHLLVYLVVSPWYNDKTLDLYELGFYRVRKGGGGIGFTGIVKAFEDIARQCGATRIVVGTSLPSNKEALARLYRRAGYTDHATALFKEVDNGN